MAGASIESDVQKDLDDMQQDLLTRATENLRQATRDASTVDELKKIMAAHGGIVRIPWCGKNSCEDRLGEAAGGKILNIPLEQNAASGKCASCGEPAKIVVNYGKSY